MDTYLGDLRVLVLREAHRGYDTRSADFGADGAGWACESPYWSTVDPMPPREAIHILVLYNLCQSKKQTMRDGFG